MPALSEPIPTAHARSAWAAGVDPLRKAFPKHAEQLLRAIAFSHIASLPVQIFINGGPRTGKTTLTEALADLADEQEPVQIERVSLRGIRQAVVPGQPLIIDEAAPASSNANPNMFVQLHGEIFAQYSTRLHRPSVLIATGNQPVDELTASRIIYVHLPDRPGIRALKAVGSEPAVAGRRIVGSYLRQRASAVDVDKAALQIVQARPLDNERRLAAALFVGDQILRSLDLDDPPGPSTAWLLPDDQVVWAVREAILYLLANGGKLVDSPTDTSDWSIGRIDEHYVYLRPAEALPFIRAAAGNDRLSTHGIAAALRRTALLETTRGTVLARIDGTPARVWRILRQILD